MLIAYIPTHNNEKTIEKTILSLKNTKIVIVDFGSTDDTLLICKKYAEIHRFPADYDRSKALNNILDDDWHLYIKPGEVLVQGHEKLQNPSKNAYFSVFSGNVLTKEIRLWKKGHFVNPIYEYVMAIEASEMKVVVYAENTNYYYDLVKKWQKNQPLSAEPVYYLACTLLAQGKYEDFLRTAEYYLFLDTSITMSTVMTRYYYSLISLQKTNKITPTLQNINLCLCTKPLMAEFWCLLGDVYYHRLHNFDFAKEFYENAIFLGSRRLATDLWPMDISKYKVYPEIMIESCKKMLENKSIYINRPGD